MKHKKLQRKSTDGDADDKNSEHTHSGEEGDHSLERANSDCSDISSVGGNDHDNLDDNEEIDVVSDNQNAVASSNHATTSPVAPTIIRQPFPIKPPMPSSVHSSLLPPSAFLSSPHLAALPMKAKFSN